MYKAKIKNSMWIDETYKKTKITDTKQTIEILLSTQKLNNL